MSSGKILIFDVETTGTDNQCDQVIELCLQEGLGDKPRVKTWRIRPDVPISPGAEAVHGISMADLQNSPSFSEIAAELRQELEEAEVWVGYNLRFDIEMVQAEFRRLGQAPIDLSEKLIVDPYRLWQQCEPRSLGHAHLRFVGHDFESAHSAEADVAATGRVLTGMMEHFGLGGVPWDTIADVCNPERRFQIGGTRHLKWNEDGTALLIGFGKHSGTDLSDLAQGPDAGYLRWILDKDFPEHFKSACERALRVSSKELVVWANDEFGPLPPARKLQLGRVEEPAAPRPCPLAKGSGPVPQTQRQVPLQPELQPSKSQKKTTKKKSVPKKSELQSKDTSTEREKAVSAKKSEPVQQSLFSLL